MRKYVRYHNPQKSQYFFFNTKILIMQINHIKFSQIYLFSNYILPNKITSITETTPIHPALTPIAELGFLKLICFVARLENSVPGKSSVSPYPI